MYLCERLVIRINIPKAYPTMHLRALKSRTQHQIMFAGGNLIIVHTLTTINIEKLMCDCVCRSLFETVCIGLILIFLSNGDVVY